MARVLHLIGTIWVCLFFVTALAAGQNQTSGANSPENLASSAAVSVPRLIEFTGEVKDRRGEPIPSAVVRLTFSVYEGQHGGEPLWRESQVVELDGRGRYTVLLGARSNGLPLELFPAGKSRWLGIQVENQDEEPRVLMVSVPYALKAEEAEKLGGRLASEYVLAEQLDEKVRTAVAVEVPATSKSVQKEPALAGAPAAPGGGGGGGTGGPKLGATIFTDSNDTQVVSIEQQGTGKALTTTGSGEVTLWSGNSAPGGYAVWGAANGPDANGLAGYANATTGSGIGVKGDAHGQNGTGVVGQAFGTNGTAIFGWAYATSGNTTGIRSEVASPDGTAMVFRNTGGGTLMSGLSGAFPGTEKFRVDGDGNVWTNGGVTATSFSGDGSQLSNVNALSLGGLLPGSFAQRSGGNSFAGDQNINGNLNLSGTINSGLRIETTSGAPNVIGGSADNTVTSGAVAATIAGGHTNRVTDECGTIGGGQSNRAGNEADDVTWSCATVAGGNGNTASGTIAFVGGGESNVASGEFSTVAGGGTNTASGNSSVIAGGRGNTASEWLTTVGGGGTNTASGFGGTVGGGDHNIAQGYMATVPGGELNTAGGGSSFAAGYRAKANDAGSFVWGDRSVEEDVTSRGPDTFVVRATGGGFFTNDLTAARFFGDGSGLTNIVAANAFALEGLPAADFAQRSGGNSFAGDQNISGNLNLTGSINGGLRIEVAPGTDNVIGGHSENWVASGVGAATISGGGTPGLANRVTASFGTVGGGQGNQAGDEAGTALHATVAGGDQNTASSSFTFVGGGTVNSASGINATVSGGAGNSASGVSATIGGGNDNVVSGNAATVPGGSLNTAQGESSFAAGNRAKALHNGAFVWADTSGGEFASTADNEFRVRATGGGFFTNDLTAARFFGDGSGLTNIVAANAFALEGLPAADFAQRSGGNNLAGDQNISGNLNLTGTINSLGLRVEPVSGTDPNIIAGSSANTITSGAIYATIGGGGNSDAGNLVTDEGGTVSGGLSNQAGDGAGTQNDAVLATVSGGQGNKASGRRSTVGGGGDNTAGGNDSTVGGGHDNAASGDVSTLAGGGRNTASGVTSTVGGGDSNIASGGGATVPGGGGNTAAGTTSFAAGSSAKALHDGAFVWGDSSGGEVTSTGDNQFVVRATGGAFFTNDLTAARFFGDGSGLTSVQADFAVFAGEAANAETLGGVSAFGFAQLGTNNSFVGDQNVSGSVTASYVFGSSPQPDGTGVRGQGLYGVAGYGSERGVWGDTENPEGWGVIGENHNTTGGVGVYGTSSSANGYGVWGGNWSGGVGVHGQGNRVGVEGIADLENGVGVRGDATSGTGINVGVLGTTASDGGMGVRGEVQQWNATAGVFDNLGGGKSLSGRSAGVEVFNVDGGGNVYASGGMTATSFSGDGSGLTNLPPSTANDLNCTNCVSAGELDFVPVTETDLGNEATARQTADAAEATARSEADAALDAAKISKGGDSMTGPLNVSNSTASGFGLRADSGDGTGVSYGVRGFANGIIGAGVQGVASAASGSTIGVEGLSSGASGIGVRGAVTNSGATAGIFDNTGGGTLILGRSSGANPVFRVEGNGSVAIGSSTAATNIFTVQQGSATDPVADAWTVYSSRRWKTNIQPIQGALDKVEQLRGVTFEWKRDGKHDIGLIAEEVGKVVPEVVAFEENGKDAKSVDYARLTVLLIEALKDQQAQIRELRAQVERMRAQLNKGTGAAGE